jgi:REP element-mobilizing transposase RayT
MSEGYVIQNQAAPYFLTFTVVDWVDIFTRKIYKNIVIDSLKFCQKNKGMEIYGFVIMSNHIHLIIQSNERALSALIKDFKSFVAKSILNKIKEGPESRADWMLKRFQFAAKSNSRNSEYQFWKYGNHPEEIFTEQFLWTKLNYIHMNPVRAGIVSKASEYIYCSASNYINGKGVLEIELPSQPIIDIHSKKRYNFEIDVW